MKLVSPTSPRPLELTANERELLSRVWNRAGCPLPRVDPQEVDDAAEAVKSAIPDLVLAILIAEGRTPGALFALTEAISTYYEASEIRDWRRASAFDHVAFTESPGGDGSEPVFACFKRTRDPARLELIEWNLRKPTRGGDKLTLSTYVTTYAQAPETNEPIDALAFQPVIEPAPKVIRVVVHAKFGEGTVIEQLSDDKLRIDFGDAGIRVLHTSYVNPKS